MRKDTSLLKGLAPLLVLRGLEKQERSGMDIIRWLKDQDSSRIEMPEGTIYPLLYRLQKQKLVTSRWKPGDGTRRVRTYRLTDAGLRQLQEQRDHWQKASTAMSLLL